MENHQTKHSLRQGLISRVYYVIKPLIPRGIQIILRRYFVRRKLPKVAGIWPIDPKSAKEPTGWKGWPEGKKFALVLTHDVDSERGLKRCRQLAEMEIESGFRSSFNFLLKKYQVPDDLRHFLQKNGFEVGIHGLYHDGKKFRSRKTFMKRAEVINQYLKEWGAVGFRAPSMHCNLDWISHLNIEYDLSTFDTDPFEPKAWGMGTIFPFFVHKENGPGGFIELPYTLPQDFTLFVILQEDSTRIWEQKLDWVAQNEGMALTNVHPDYMVFDGARYGIDEYPCHLYLEFLSHIKERYENRVYHCLPRELASFYASQYDRTANQPKKGFQR